MEATFRWWWRKINHCCLLFRIKKNRIFTVSYTHLEFAVHDIKIIEGEKGVFIAMPSRKNAEGEYRDVAHPINSDTRTQLQEMIMEKYREEIAEA